MLQRVIVLAPVVLNGHSERVARRRGWLAIAAFILIAACADNSRTTTSEAAVSLTVTSGPGASFPENPFWSAAKNDDVVLLDEYLQSIEGEAGRLEQTLCDPSLAGVLRAGAARFDGGPLGLAVDSVRRSGDEVDFVIGHAGLEIAAHAQTGERSDGPRGMCVEELILVPDVDQATRDAVEVRP